MTSFLFRNRNRSDVYGPSVQSLGGQAQRDEKRLRGHSRGDGKREFLRRALLTAPLVSYAVMTAWMCLHGQWTFLVFLLPSAIMGVASACDQWNTRNEQDFSTGHDTHVTPSTGRDDDPVGRNSQLQLPAERSQQALDALTELANDVEEWNFERNQHAPTWQRLVHVWLAPSTRISLGAGPQIDICTDGPHALLAGTTGSGKSVLLQRWLYALAEANSPADVQFIFLDFKGGATFTHSRSLPHCAGSVSNLNIAHARRALRALNEQMLLREKLLDDAHVADIRELSAPPPRLVILADEFFALVNSLPDCAPLCATLISLGRSLGMHFILCTQNPLNQVSSHIKANMPLHLCLRVTDALQSVDMLGSPCAAGIPSTLPGAAFCCRDGNIEPLCVVSYDHSSSLLRSCLLACEFLRVDPASELFSEPLPRILLREYSSNTPYQLTVGEVDDGMTRTLWTLDTSCCHLLVFCGLNATDGCMVLESLTESFELVESASSASESSEASEASEEVAPISTSSLRLLTLVEPDPIRQAEELSALLRDESVFLVVTLSQWSRFLSRVPGSDRALWDTATLCVPAHLASSMMIPEKHMSASVKDITADYPQPHPLRFVVYAPSSRPSCFYAQLFSSRVEVTENPVKRTHVENFANSQKSLEKFDHVWFAMRKEKD
ncbi:FtsK/SpoIIIE domain-containing protein [Alloscardovia macacae]|uniref:FtsK/SpoIIIE family protein n=1 Tax=Alloscardovia macacae TaxID=1160091 RepID=A0A261F597_9BIFI|nr:FtsK/SpoIIIE domain-containing protein [Alloscardovia macacae]OZG54268.1 FtsK/SpoIIIE family protein [Alloscardovia macacae]